MRTESEPNVSAETTFGRVGSGNAGQATVEWVGLVTLTAALFAALALVAGSIPGTALVHSVSRSILCAASLSTDCFSEGSLEEAYGAEVAAMIRANTPDLFFGPDLLGLPVDFRSCRSPACADPPDEGVIGESTAGEPVTLFTRVVDCRDGRRADPDGSDGVAGSGCTAEAEGNIYLQYWAYYPESASLRGLPVLEEQGYHRHDWESVQFRIGPDGKVDQRASSHAGYNHTRSAANWGSDIGSGLIRQITEAAGFRERGGWGISRRTLLVAGGSHAGNVGGSISEGRYPTRTPARLIRLIPLESIQGGSLVRPADFDPITPPWRKSVWYEPESEGTG
ncbi:MAG: hypothetical protein WD181_01100 [Solirubrobacterales bacterium]